MMRPRAIGTSGDTHRGERLEHRRVGEAAARQIGRAEAEADDHVPPEFLALSYRAWRDDRDDSACAE
jgi:hypothetical protein